MSFAAYASVATVVALSARNLDSLERYSLSTVPLVVAAAELIGGGTRDAPRSSCSVPRWWPSPYSRSRVCSSREYGPGTRQYGGIRRPLGTLPAAAVGGARPQRDGTRPTGLPSEMAERQIADVSAGPEPRTVVVIGAGPAGLTAAYEFMKEGRAAEVIILESTDVVGGISQTVQRDGWRFDLGGHRFFTKVTEVNELWNEILAPETMLDRPRQSRMLYRGKLYDYPLVPMNVMRNLGPIEATRCVLSYFWARVRPPKNQDNLEGFYAARFGWRLYRHFFKTYTEKVWGVPVTELSADWGAQRVKDLSLGRAVVEAFKPKRFRRSQDAAHAVTSLIEEFKYPKYGPGMMWEIAHARR